MSLLLLSEWISLLHKSFNPIKKRKRAILCPLPSPPPPSSWVSSLSHHFLPHWWANYKKFHSLEVRFGTRESAVPENDLSVGWLWDFCPNLLPLWRKDCLFLLLSSTILRWMPLSHTDLFIFRALIFPTVRKIPTAIRTVWKSIQIQHSLPTLQILNNAASRFTGSSLNVRHASSRKLFTLLFFLSVSTCWEFRFWSRTTFLVARKSRYFLFPYTLSFRWPCFVINSYNNTN